jgi:hypothetical protein
MVRREPDWWDGAGVGVVKPGFECPVDSPEKLATLTGFEPVLFT